ncbi:respiratory nitrate reductase subunit gamma [Desulfovibrio sp. OttesenSCG-928-I05]|nr:respiratory nitrate reductase subunit gamma [Desulfovibrio sp. OttesenSCG-928-I05]
MYSLLTGPLLGISLLVFFGGMAWRIFWYIKGLDWRLERVAYRPYMKRGLKGAVQSIWRWLVPYGTHSWRQHPFFAGAFFLFHLGAIFVPLFLAGHMVIMERQLGFSLPALPQIVSDVLTLGTIAAGGFIIARRLALPEVRILTTLYDYFILCLSLAPFVTGFLAAANAPGYDFWLLLHILCGELFLILAPFTKLSHIALFFMSRGQLGMDYAIKRGGEFRGTSFPW